MAGLYEKKNSKKGNLASFIRSCSKCPRVWRVHYSFWESVGHLKKDKILVVATNSGKAAKKFLDRRRGQGGCPAVIEIEDIGCVIL